MNIFQIGLMRPQLEADAAVTGGIIFQIILGYILCALAAYLLGGINTSIIASKMFFGDDIRNHGSKNAGLTNMHRVYGMKGAAMTLVGDILKTVIAVVIGMLLMGTPGGYVAGFCTMLGHTFPVYFNFKGGKGVLCAAAAILVLDPLTFALLLVVFVAVVALTKYISAASMTVAFFLPLVTHAFHQDKPYIVILIMTFCMFGFIIWTHRSNIKRLLNHEENKFSFKKK